VDVAELVVAMQDEEARFEAAVRRLRARLFRLSAPQLSAQQRARVLRAISALADAWGAPDDEGIDYSDLPDLGDDAAFWTGGRIGPVLPPRAAERSGTGA
jgi:hypothetical protein